MDGRVADNCEFLMTEDILVGLIHKRPVGLQAEGFAEGAVQGVAVGPGLVGGALQVAAGGVQDFENFHAQAAVSCSESRPASRCAQSVPR